MIILLIELEVRTTILLTLLKQHRLCKVKCETILLIDFSFLSRGHFVL